MVTMGQRDAGRRRRPLCRADAGNHLERDACSCQALRLLAAAAEHVGVAALQAHQAAAALRQPHHQLDDALLRQRVMTALLADVDEIGLGRHQAEHGLGDEVVVQHQRGSTQRMGRLHRQQLGIAGAGADQRDTRRAHAGIAFGAELQGLAEQGHGWLPG
jgi:hypothetical protein